MEIPPLWENSTMALNIKDKETETLVAEIAALTGETKTGAVRKAARERLERLRLQEDPRRDAESFRRFLETEIWPLIPDELLGKSISKAEREEILGYGPDGY
jgi:antitoxin VapB